MVNSPRRIILGKWCTVGNSYDSSWRIFATAKCCYLCIKEANCQLKKDTEGHRGLCKFPTANSPNSSPESADFLTANSPTSPPRIPYREFADLSLSLANIDQWIRGESMANVPELRECWYTSAAFWSLIPISNAWEGRAQCYKNVRNIIPTLMRITFPRPDLLGHIWSERWICVWWIR